MKKALLGGSATVGAGLLASRSASGQAATIPPTVGDIAILRFVAAAELIEADLWQQYAELGGLTPGQLPVETTASFTPMNSYQAAFMQLDPDGPQYVSSNTGDEQSHAAFLNAYLQSIGALPINLDHYRTLPSSPLSPTPTLGRLTNLTQLSVDTSWFTRYRSTTNPDLGGAPYPQALPQLSSGQYKAIPLTTTDIAPLVNGVPPANVQAIANTAAFHFGYIEQGGLSLYAALSQKVTSPQVLQITLGIGGDEICHFLEWVDFAGNGVQGPVAPFTDPISGLTFPDFNVSVPVNNGMTPPNPLLQTNLIFPVPCAFINANLPWVAVLRPLSDAQGGAVATINSFIADGLFIGQPTSFTNYLMQLAQAADAAVRQAV